MELERRETEICFCSYPARAEHQPYDQPVVLDKNQPNVITIRNPVSHLSTIFYQHSYYSFLEFQARTTRCVKFLRLVLYFFTNEGPYSILPSLMQFL